MREESFARQHHHGRKPETDPENAPEGHVLAEKPRRRNRAQNDPTPQDDRSGRSDGATAAQRGEHQHARKGDGKATASTQRDARSRGLHRATADSESEAD